MLKLKYLFANFDLAEMIVKRWNYDNTELFKYWRVSSNAIYPFSSEEKIYFLRITPALEKEKDEILAELDFLTYLKNCGYSAIQAVPSKKDEELEIVDTPWSKYYAAVFKRVNGEPLEKIELTDEIVRLWGSALGKLHKLSRDYIPTGCKRPNHEQILDWALRVLSDFPEEKQAVREVQMLKVYFKHLPQTKDNYGLIHYDFELDNVFYDGTTGEISPIDFDDAMYHYYAMDIEQTINSIRGELPLERAEDVILKFIEGYREEYDISDEMLSHMPVFRRFANLYGYVRVLLAVSEKWENEPEWMINLRTKLNDVLAKRSRTFPKFI